MSWYDSLVGDNSQNYYGINDQDRRNAAIDAQQAFGQSLLQGAMSGDWGQFGSAIGMGLIGARQATKAGLKQASEQHQDTEKFQLAKAHDEIANQIAKLSLDKAKDQYIDDNQLSDAIKANADADYNNITAQIQASNLPDALKKARLAEAKLLYIRNKNNPSDDSIRDAQGFVQRIGNDIGAPDLAAKAMIDHDKAMAAQLGIPYEVYVKQEQHSRDTKLKSEDLDLQYKQAEINRANAQAEKDREAQGMGGGNFLKMFYGSINKNKADIQKEIETITDPRTQAENPDFVASIASKLKIGMNPDGTLSKEGMLRAQSLLQPDNLDQAALDRTYSSVDIMKALASGNRTLKDPAQVLDTIARLEKYKDTPAYKALKGSGKYSDEEILNIIEKETANRNRK